MEESGMAVVFTGKPSHVRELADVLRAAGIESFVGAPPQAGGQGWGATLWLAVASPNYDAACQALDRHLHPDLDEGALRSAQACVDLDADETTCPACQSRVRLVDSRCPECGLRFGG